MPNDRYWHIKRPHGGNFTPDEDLRYASIMTSSGCPFKCTYCHIAHEIPGSISGEIGRFRIKSDERVLSELRYLKDVLKVKQVYIEDDSIFGKKKRAINLLKKVMEMGLRILNVNGVNLIHLVHNDGSPDLELLDLLKNTGFEEIILPFESPHKRLIKQYATNKWNPDTLDVEALIKACKSKNIRIVGNYMIGFPSETLEEVKATISFAKQCRAWGLDYACFFCVMPLPGTPLFDECIEKKLLPKDYDIDRMN